MSETAKLVAIVGGSGAGKTWLSDELHKSLPDLSVRLSQDSFYRDRSHLSPSQRLRVNYDRPQAIDWPTLEHALEECKRRRPVRVPEYDFQTHERLEDSNVLSPRPLVIVDGLWLLHHPRIRKLFDLRIFIQCPLKLRLRRRIQRDVAERGRDRHSVRRQFYCHVDPMHRRYVQPQCRMADILLNHPPGREEVEMLGRALMSSFLPQEIRWPAGPNPCGSELVFAEGGIHE
jgi:uridine kinase